MSVLSSNFGRNLIYESWNADENKQGCCVYYSRELIYPTAQRRKTRKSYSTLLTPTYFDEFHISSWNFPPQISKSDIMALECSINDEGY